MSVAPHKPELILQFAGEGILVLDHQGWITFANAAAERMLGYTREDLGKGLAHNIIHHSKRDGSPYPAEECPLLESCRDGTPYQDSDAVFWQKNGRPLEVRYVSTPIWEDGRLSGAVVVFGDNTMFKQNEGLLARWQNVFAHAEWGMIVYDVVAEKIELMNPAFARMHGYSVEELAGWSIDKFFAEECRADLPRRIRLVHETGHHVWESWHVRKDGSRFPVQIDATAVKDETGQVLYRVLNVQDITARRHTEDILRESEARLRAQTQGMLGLGGEYSQWHAGVFGRKLSYIRVGPGDPAQLQNHL